MKLLLLLVGVGALVCINGTYVDLCDQSVCSGFVLPGQTYGVLCDVSCLTPTLALGGSRGCIANTSCRKCSKGAGDEFPSCKQTRLQNFVSHFTALGVAPISDPQEAADAWLAPSEELITPTTATDPGGAYTVVGAGVWVGPVAMSEYLIAALPAGNFGQYRFTTSLLTSFTKDSGGSNSYTAVWRVGAVPLPSGAEVLGTQTVKLTYPKGSDLSPKTDVYLDNSFVTTLSAALSTSDTATLCGAFGYYCEVLPQNPINIGYKSTVTGYFDIPTCVASLTQKDVFYYGTYYPTHLSTATPLSDDTISCRQLHIILATLRPDVHCPHVAEVSTVCIT